MKKKKQNERKQKRKNIVEVINFGSFFELAKINKRYVNGLNLHEIKDELLEDYKSDFDLAGFVLIGEIEQKTNIRFRNVGDFETYTNDIYNGGYDSEYVLFTGWLYKTNTPEINKVNRSQYGRGTDFKQDIVEYIGNNCYIPTSGTCFEKCINYLTKKDYTHEFLPLFEQIKEHPMLRHLLGFYHSVENIITIQDVMMGLEYVLE